MKLKITVYLDVC